jgi:hypothetical protein
VPLHQLPLKPARKRHSFVLGGPGGLARDAGPAARAA